MLEDGSSRSPEIAAFHEQYAAVHRTIEEGDKPDDA
jgi:hypothetical protein